MRARYLLLFLLLLVPSAQYAWRTRDMPGFGAYAGHDAAILFSSAKSLALGEGYRVLSLPEQPAQTKYPILYPLYLSLIWRIVPSFPDNLRVAIWFTWPLIALFLALALAYYRREGLSTFETWIPLALLATSPHVILYGCNTLSDIPFTCCLLGVFLILDRDGESKDVSGAFAAGILAGIGYLVRTAGLPLLIAVPAWYYWKKSPRRAAAFAVGMLPFILGWGIWTRMHMLHSNDPALVYYIDYIKYELMNVGLDNIHKVVWHNTDYLIYSMGSLFFPKIFGGLFMKIVAELVGVAMISGVVRLVRRGIAVPYALYALINAAMLIVWQYPPDERFVLPIFPLLAVGLIAELSHVAAMTQKAFRHKDFSQRAAAAAFASVVVLFLVVSVALQGYVTISFLGDAKPARDKIAGLQPVYAWIEKNVPVGSGILSNDDPLLYLYTGRRGNGLFPLTRDWCYGDPDSSIFNAYRNIAAFARSRGLQYVYSAPDDLFRMTSDPELTAKVEQNIRANPELTPVFQGPTGILYKVREAQ